MLFCKVTNGLEQKAYGHWCDGGHIFSDASY